jgi:hypothetical protein
MKFQTLIEKVLTTIGHRVHKAPHNKLAELGANGVARSSFAVTSTFSSLTDELKNELMTFLDSIAKTNIRKKHIQILEMMIEKSIIKEYEAHKRYLESINVLNIGNIDWNDFINNQKEDTIVAVNVKLLILRKAASDRKIKVWWDVGKILLSAIIGGVIGSYIKSKM